MITLYLYLIISYLFYSGILLKELVLNKYKNNSKTAIIIAVIIYLLAPITLPIYVGYILTN